MGKQKRMASKRAKLEARIQARKTTTSKTNPFEVQVNKQKLQVLGRRPGKGEIGRPSKSRYDAVVKRKETLLKEYLSKHKTGKGLVDRRVKEVDGGVAARKAKLFSEIKLAEKADPVTHEGTNINNLNVRQLKRDHVIRDEDGIDLLKRSDYVEAAHFGGGFSGQPMSSAEYLEEIAEEKFRRKMEREENVQLTKKLDEDWGLLRNLIKHKGAQEEKTGGKNEDYDVLLTSLLFGDEEKRPIIKKADQAKELAQAKVASMNVIILEKLNSMMKSKDVEEIKECFEFILINVKRVNSSVTEHLLRYLSSKGLMKCTLKSYCLLVFALCFKELQSFALTKLIAFLRRSTYSSVEKVAQKILLCHIFFTLPYEKFIPEIIVTLQNLLILFCRENSLKDKFIPSFLYEKFNSTDVYDIEDLNPDDIKSTLTFSEFLDSNLSSKEAIRQKFLHLCLQLLLKFTNTYKKFESFESIFSNFPAIFVILTEKFPKLTSNIVEQISSVSEKPREASSEPIKKRQPKMITMLEPRIEPVKKKHDSRKLLVKSYKREFKGAQRELRKDNAFIRDTVLKETLDKDRRRKEKVKKLIAEIAEERSMFKKKRK